MLKTNKDVTLHVDGKQLFIKQPNIAELNELYVVIMVNRKIIKTVFRFHHKDLE